MQRAVLQKSVASAQRILNNQRLLTQAKSSLFYAGINNNNEGLRWYSAGQPAAVSNYVEEMHKAWQRDPSSVHATWDEFFRQASGQGRTGGLPASSASLAATGGFSPTEANIIDNHNNVSKIIRAYQVHGHLIANLDPLGITSGHLSLKKASRPTSDPRRYAVIKTYLDDISDDNKMEMMFKLPPSCYIGGPNEQSLPLKEIIRRLESVYCGSIGAEYHHLVNPEQIAWVRERLERPGAAQLDQVTRQRTLKRLMRATQFEAFLAKKWSSEKRFGLEGCEALIPAMKQIIDRSTTYGVESFVMGMPHRGRLNVLANVCRKPLEQLFIQFAGLEAEDSGSGDVKYHLGTYVERLNRATNKNTRVAVVANPSHLEAVDPVVQGKTKAEQFYKGDDEGRTVMSILVHGDAAFAGQGVVFETFHLSELPAYTTHGTVHIVANNQIGFTTDPRHSRSSPYCTDVGKVVNAPIFHVNADDLDAVIHVANIAADFRATFHRDVVIDLVGYRRHGHNEIDEPMFTQPLMYRRVRQTPPVLEKYSKKLIEDGTITEAEFKNKKVQYDQICEQSFKDAQNITRMKLRDWLDSPWKGFFKGERRANPTGIDEETLVHIGTKFSTPPPDGFEIHRGLHRILSARMDMVKSRTLDWALGEALAYGSLMKEGVHVRLSGQDVERGTFSHRHHILHHQSQDKAIYSPLSHLYPDQAPYVVCNSSLSEYAVLGFELGYSMTNPNSLVMWEAQFGDFNNTAQCIIDQFICSGEAKWVRQSGLVMLLPHGMEGMGPEHSSARVERFLQMSDDDPDTPPEQLGEGTMLKQLEETNWIVANCTTPANIFHILRRQIALPFRKPLIIMTPKSLLRLPDARSSFDELLPGTNFRPVLGEDQQKNFKKLLLCSGKVYYDLLHARKERGLENDYALIRVEQLTPFPYAELKEELSKYPNADVVWVQEEHKNQGPWSYVRPRLRHVTDGRNVTYVGRHVSPSPATGSKYGHTREVEALLANAFK